MTYPPVIYVTHPPLYVFEHPLQVHKPTLRVERFRPSFDAQPLSNLHPKKRESDEAATWSHKSCLPVSAQKPCKKTLERALENP